MDKLMVFHFWFKIKLLHIHTSQYALAIQSMISNLVRKLGRIRERERACLLMTSYVAFAVLQNSLCRVVPGLVQRNSHRLACSVWSLWCACCLTEWQNGSKLWECAVSGWALVLMGYGQSPSLFTHILALHLWLIFRWLALLCTFSSTWGTLV